MEEVKCDGWGVHDCPNEPVCILVCPGCKHCGGQFPCLDTGSWELSCLECAEPFKKYALKNTDQEYTITDLEDNIIWTNQESVV